MNNYKVATFDCVESDGILKFLHRLDSSQTVEILESDLVPSNNKDIKETLEITLAQELELPQKVSVSHIDRCQNYETLTVEAQRQIVSTRDQINFSLPIVLDNSTAKQIADITLYNSWQERIEYKLTLPPKYAYLEPTDIINVKCNNVNYSMRIIKTDMQRTGQMRLLATNSNLQIYDFSSQVNYLSSKLEVPKLLPNTLIEIMDLPIMPNDSEPNQSFISFAVNSDDSNWSGSIIYSDNGVRNYKPLAVCNIQSTIGVIINKIPAASPLLFDESTEIIAQLLHGTLSSTTELSLLSGANKALIGNEIIQFQNAENIGDKKYKLTKLLRGRNGTEYAIIKHKIGDKFTLLDNKIVSVSIPNNLIGKPINYKAVTLGKTLAEAESINFTYSGNVLKPLSPVHVKAEKDELGNINISWIRRTRTDNDWRDYDDVAIGEEPEKYEIDIKKKRTLIRTLSSNTESVTYTKQQITSDFTNPPTELTATIYQLSSVVGRGNSTTIPL